MDDADPRSQTLTIHVPRNNTRDVLAAEVFFAGLADARSESSAAPLTLRLLGRAEGRAFQTIGSPQAVARAQALLRHAYPQCDFACDAAALPATAVTRSADLLLREAAYLPIRSAVTRDGRVSNDDLAQGADPMLGVLAAMDGLAPGEHCAVDLTLKPMPGDWGKYWRGATADVGERAKLAPAALAALMLSALGGMLIVAAVTFLAAGIVLRTSVTPVLWGAALGALGATALALRLRLPSPADPVLIKQKTASSACRARIRLSVNAHTAARASRYLDALIQAYRAYNLAGGNGFVARHSAGARAPRERDWPVLNSAELAALWHLPHGAAGLQGVATTTAKTLLPPPELIATADSAGIHIGQARHQGQTHSVRLSRAMLAGNIGLVAKTQSGKSNLMAQLVAQIIASDPDTAVIVLDPHRRLAETICGLVPTARQPATIHLSLADRAHPFGLNLLDRTPRARAGGTGGGDSADAVAATEMFADKMTSDIIETLREIWTDNWGPRMENYLRWPLLTLAYANERLLADAAFSDWRTRALHLLRDLHVRILSSALDGRDWQLVAGLAADGLRLERPDRASAGRLHDALRAPLAVLAQAYASTVSDTRLRALEEAALLLLNAARNTAAPSGISRRVYGELGRPLQFTLLDVMPLQLSSGFRSEVRGALRQERFQHVHDWWRNSFEMFRALNLRLLLDMITPVLTKLDRFAASDVARRIFGQPDSTLDIGALLDGGGILLLDLAAGVVGQDTAALIGSTVMNWIASLLFARQKSGAPARKVLIVIDEFQSLPGVDYAFMLSELAKYGAQLMLGTQSLGYLEQVNARTRTAWLDNTSTLFVFRCGADDARTLADELSVADINPLTVSQADIVGLPDYTCYVRTRDAGGRQHVFQVRTERVAEPDPAALASIQARSRREHCRSAAEADRLIALAQHFRGEPDLGISRSAGWSHSEAGAGLAGAAQSGAPDFGDELRAISETPAAAPTGQPGQPDAARVARVRRGRADDAAEPLATLMRDDVDDEAADADAAAGEAL